MQELHLSVIAPSLNQTSNFLSNLQMAIYLESLSSIVHFPFNYVKELELSHNCAKRQVKAWADFFSTSDLKFTDKHSLKVNCNVFTS